MANRKTGRPATCDFCGDDFLSYRITVRYCSRSCAGKATAKPKRGVENPRYNGGFSTWQGRTVITCRDGGVMLYSRALMAGHVGRLLKSDEIVHHVNGDPTDDCVENLQVLSRAQHIEIHRAELLEARKSRSSRKLAKAVA